MQMVLKDELQVISQQMSGQHVLDAYIPDSSPPLKCQSRSYRNKGHKCKDCDEWFLIEKEENKKPEPEKKRVCQKIRMVNQLRNTCTNYQ